MLHHQHHHTNDATIHEVKLEGRKYGNVVIVDMSINNQVASHKVAI